MREDEMVRWHHRLNGHECEPTPGNSEGEGRLVCYGPWSCKEWDTSERLNNNGHHSCFTMLYWFLLYSETKQLYVYLYPFFFFLIFLPAPLKSVCQRRASQSTSPHKAFAIPLLPHHLSLFLILGHFLFYAPSPYSTN